MGNPEKPSEEQAKVKHRSVTISSDKEEKDMEEGKQSAKAFMPNLPKPLTIEEKKYLLAVERGDISSVRKMLQKSHRHPEYMNKDCVDPLGRGALHMSIDNENLEMVELLVVMGIQTMDALLHAIDVEFVEAVEVLLEHEEVIHKEGEPYSWEKVDRQTASFTPEITPLILAAHRDNYEILKILLDRGAMLPMPHDIRCGCPECIKSSSEDSLRHSMSRINSYRALASPSLIALSSTDPILTAFELSWELKNLAYSEQEFRREYLELRRQCRDFAEELLSHTRSSTELAVILNYDPDATPYEDGEHMKLRRLELAIDYKQKKFVAHANVQQLLAAIWYEGLPGFRRKTVTDRLMEIVKVALFFPFYCMHYMIKPESPTGKLMRTPFMKFLIHSSSYLFFLLLLILVSVRFEDLVIYLLGTDSMRRNLEEASRRQRGNLPTPTEFFVFIYVFGFIWEEILEIRSEGVFKYMKNMWNILDVMRDSLYITTILLRIGAYIHQSMEIANDPSTAYIPKEEWDTFDPQLISEGLFSAANILSALKLVHIFSINPYLGPLQISLGRMVIDIVKFFFIYTLVLFAFACGLTQLLWYYNDLEKQKCYSLPGGMPDWTKQGDACMKWRRFHNLFEASQSLFWAGFGMVGLSDFELTGIREYTRFWSMLMFGTYSVINIIVLLNLLIAMMSSSYSFIVEHADTEWKFARSKLWMSYFEEGKTLPPPFNIFPNVKMFRKYFSSDDEQKKFKRMSTRTQRIKRKARDYRYLGVMRALIWRYVCSLQKRNVESPVTEDDVNEVKGDISSLRFELIDLFGQNGMDISSCSKKSKAALGRKMKIWERRLMRDFHVSPAMGSEDSTAIPEEPPENTDSKAADRFRRIAKLAMTPKVTDIASVVTGTKIASQIGRTNFHDDSGRENLKKAMEKARRKMEEDTPDGSPNSSRGCSPYPDLYTGPHLLDAINSLELSPTASAANTPMPPEGTLKKRDGQAKDPNLLTIPGRRSEKSLDSANNEGGVSLDVPTEIFSLNAFKALSEKKSSGNSAKNDVNPKANQPKPEKKPQVVESKPPPATLSTVSEMNPMQIKKKEESTQNKVAGLEKNKVSEDKGEKKQLKTASSEIPVFQTQNKEEAKWQKPQLGPKDSALLKSGEILQPSVIKSGNYQTPQVHKANEPNNKNNNSFPASTANAISNNNNNTDNKNSNTNNNNNNNSNNVNSSNVSSNKGPAKPAALRIDPFGQTKNAAPLPSMIRPRPLGPNADAKEKPVIPVVKPFQQPPDQVELQNTEIVRKPRMLPKQSSREILEEPKLPETKTNITPSIKPVIQSKPKETIESKGKSPEETEKTKTPAPASSTILSPTKVEELPKKDQPKPVPPVQNVVPKPIKVDVKKEKDPEPTKNVDEKSKMQKEITGSDSKQKEPTKREAPKPKQEEEKKIEEKDTGKAKNNVDCLNPKPPVEVTKENLKDLKENVTSKPQETKCDSNTEKKADKTSEVVKPAAPRKRTESVEEKGITPTQVKKGGWL